MTRIQQYSAEVKEISLNMIKANMPEPYKIRIELVVFENNPMQLVSERINMVAQTYEQTYLQSKGFTKCKRKEATAIVYISKWDADREDWISIKHHYVNNLANS